MNQQKPLWPRFIDKGDFPKHPGHYPVALKEYPDNIYVHYFDGDIFLNDLLSPLELEVSHWYSEEPPVSESLEQAAEKVLDQVFYDECIDEEPYRLLTTKPHKAVIKAMVQFALSQQPTPPAPVSSEVVDPVEFAKWVLKNEWKWDEQVLGWRNNKGIVIIEFPTSPLYISSDRLVKEYVKSETTTKK